jgi:hypothetical protein
MSNEYATLLAYRFVIEDLLTISAVATNGSRWPHPVLSNLKVSPHPSAYVGHEGPKADRLARPATNKLGHCRFPIIRFVVSEPHSKDPP